ncbi:MAG: histone deacetylase [Hyphomicrobiaceae bacterium]|nr:histone deacetylase [Hyphomicrobiaceae bacterium]
MHLPIVHSPLYRAELPGDHRFPMAKFGRLADLLLADGLAGPGGFHDAAEAPAEWIALAHDRAYVDQVFNGEVPERIAREIGFPMSASVRRRARASVGGTVLTARLALEHGIACNTAGGSHHARRAHGAGFCVFNDVAVAIRVLQADGMIERALVIDLDVHQGDGTADIFAGDASVTTVSVHAARNYPVRKVAGDIDIGLDDDTGDAAYLDLVRRLVPAAIADARPDIVFYNAGVDPHRDDRLGRLGLSDKGLSERDHWVIDAVRSRGIALAGVIGGGYCSDVDVLAKRHAGLHRVASAFC